MYSKAELIKMKREDLKTICRSLSLSVRGIKDDLIDKILNAQMDEDNDDPIVEETEPIIAETEFIIEEPEPNGYTNKQLRLVLKEMHLKVRGSKEELLKRLKENNINKIKIDEIIFLNEDQISQVCTSPVSVQQNESNESKISEANSTISEDNFSHFDGMTVKSLIQEMKSRGLGGYSGKNKADLITKLKHYETEMEKINIEKQNMIDYGNCDECKHISLFVTPKAKFKCHDCEIKLCEQCELAHK